MMTWVARPANASPSMMAKSHPFVGSLEDRLPNRGDRMGEVLISDAVASVLSGNKKTTHSHKILDINQNFKNAVNTAISISTIF